MHDEVIVYDASSSPMGIFANMVCVHTCVRGFSSFLSYFIFCLSGAHLDTYRNYEIGGGARFEREQEKRFRGTMND